MERRKLTKEDIDKVRNIDGFPIGRDEDIIALSDAPYYTACPNPFIEEFIKENGTPYDEATDDYHREPFAADVSEGKNDPIYMAHSYHTKVPHKAIMRYILHYTKPGDIVFDGFCGTGMTGVAAEKCGEPDYETQIKISASMKDAKWGYRYSVLNDLAPIASFISYNYSNLNGRREFQTEVERVIQESYERLAWMYQTRHYRKQSSQIALDDKQFDIGTINYTVWSDVFICPNCSTEFVFGDVAIDSTGSVMSSFVCPSCNAKLKKDDCKHAVHSFFDPVLKEPHETNKQVPVLINYSVGKKRYEKKPDAFDLETLRKIEALASSEHLYTLPMMHKGGSNWGEIWRAGYHYGITHSHHFYTLRNYIVLSDLWSKSKNAKTHWAITAILNYVNKKQSYTGGGGGMPGVLYIASLVQEKNVYDVLQRKVKSLLKVLSDEKRTEHCIISTGSSTQLLNIPNDAIDYIFIDPPFGGNIMYSEASFLWESWLRVFSNNAPEAVQSSFQGKNLLDYQDLMTRSFCEFSRILKPGRWMTVEFHNSQNSVWNAIQESLSRAGFIVADVRVLDKQQGSFKQVTSQGAVKQDLVISAYKPKNAFKRELMQRAGSEDTAWAFVRQHLSNIPVVVIKEGKIEVVSERQAFLLFDRMVAYHIMQGIPVPLDATDFYRGLDERFLKRDNMYFLPDQVNEYDLTRSTTEIENIQFSLFVSDEKSAISWLYQQLDERSGNGPQTYQVLMPKFMRECQAVDKCEKMPELSTILEENFLKDEEGRWYIPDLTKSGDVARLREKNLLKEFQEYLSTKGKLKVFRSEAIRAGFAKLWKEKNYAAIVSLAERLPEETIQEDQNLLMYYDISLGRV
jgi:hypothetical protein